MKTQKKISGIPGIVGALIGLLIISQCDSAKAETGVYFTIGVATHSLGSDCPEYCGSNPLSNVGIGYTYKPSDQLYIDLYINHESSMQDTEEGYGQNKAGVQGRWYPGK